MRRSFSASSTALNTRIVDLRSDTLTLPTKEMSMAMAEAILADDVYDGDPNVQRRLEKIMFFSIAYTILYLKFH